MPFGPANRKFENRRQQDIQSDEQPGPDAAISRRYRPSQRPPVGTTRHQSFKNLVRGVAQMSHQAARKPQEVHIFFVNGARKSPSLA